jgi:hypothetical protein
MIPVSRLLIPVILCVLLAACGGKNEPSGPENSISADSLISQDKMILILSDVHTAEAGFLADRNSGTEPVNVAGIYQGIYKKYNITAGMYAQSVAYYRQKPEVYVKMYEKVTVLLEARQKQFQRTGN